ncbi:TRAP transporter large permease [Virgibacillus doumboii]|uniref:TRAP transporter large permease n=1 Tax=Virgibacillus doumboii TaxID=2697503 RepID=UPI0013DE84AD|nr:TRAP transporter large permease [Virgibacillus doumboii]
MFYLSLFGSFGLLLLIGVPIAISLGLASIFSILITGDTTISFLTVNFVNSIDSFPILAVPFFIFAGEIMAQGGLSKRLFGLADSIVGNKTGGLAIAAVISCMFFGSISGSSPATVAAMGTIMIPAMVQRGYNKTFATATIAAAGSLGVIIPPSIDMIMFGVTSNTSIGNMFLGGILPGILLGTCLMIWAYIYSKKNGYTGTDEKTSIKRILTELNNCKWALLIPVVILGGIYSGIFTPTESAVVAVVIALVSSFFIYREMGLRDIPKLMASSSATIATILIILSAATGFAKLLTIKQAPQQMADFLLSVTESPIVIIILINLMLLAVGTFMDSVPSIIILTPILFPIATNLGFEPVHFGVMMIVNLSVGFITPPVGVNLFVASGISQLSVTQIAKSIVPYFLAMVFSLFIVMIWPELSLFLVNLTQ